MTYVDRTYDGALRQRAAALEDVLAAVEAHLEELRGALRHHRDAGDLAGAAEIRARLYLVVGLQDEATDDLAEVRRLIAGRDLGPAG